MHGGGEVFYVNLALGFGRDAFGSFDALVNMEQIRGASGGTTWGLAPGDVLVGIERIIGTERNQAGMPGIGDILLGDEAANLIEGLEGNDLINGRGGDDELASGRGFDIMTGGAGADNFQFDFGVDGIDLVTDFVPGLDRIGVTAGWGWPDGLSFTATAGGIVMTNLPTGAPWLSWVPPRRTRCSRRSSCQRHTEPTTPRLDAPLAGSRRAAPPPCSVA